MVPEPSVPHTLLLLLGMPEALLSTWKFGRGWCGEVPEELRKRMKFALPSPNILNSCQLSGGSLFPLHHPAIPHGSDGVCACDIKDRVLGQEIVALLAGWKPFLWDWGCSGKCFPQPGRRAKFPDPRRGFHSCCL